MHDCKQCERDEREPELRHKLPVDLRSRLAAANELMGGMLRLQGEND